MQSNYFNFINLVGYANLPGQESYCGLLLWYQENEISLKNKKKNTLINIE
jgi:hypothetical protein